jgi:hypothetical protein
MYSKIRLQLIIQHKCNFSHIFKKIFNKRKIDSLDLEAQRSARRHAHEMEANRWDSCCFRLNKPAVLFFSHYATIIVVLITAIIGVFTDTTNKEVWLNILMLCIGAIMPAPNLKESRTAANHGA